MNMDCFLKRFCSVLLSSEQDSSFEAIKLWVGGTTSPRLAKLLNFAVSQMGDKECYVETGVFTGCTLISAHWASDKLCVGIDPYTTSINEATILNPEVIRDRARFNIQNMAAGVKLIEKDFRDVAKDEIPHPIAVSFVDARHRYEDVIDNMEWLKDKLAPDAIVIFDDVNYRGVSQAIFDWVKKDEEHWQMIGLLSPYYSSPAYTSSVMDRTAINNGLAILRYHADPKQEALFRGVWEETPQ